MKTAKHTRFTVHYTYNQLLVNINFNFGRSVFKIGIANKKK